MRGLLLTWTLKTVVNGGILRGSLEIETLSVVLDVVFKAVDS